MASCHSNRLTFGFIDLRGTGIFLGFATAAGIFCSLLQAGLPQAPIDLPPAVFEAGLVILAVSCYFFGDLCFTKRAEKPSLTTTQKDASAVWARKDTRTPKAHAQAIRPVEAIRATQAIRATECAQAKHLKQVAYSGDTERAEKMLEAMVETKMEPSISTFNAVIAALAKKADADGAERLMAQMLKSGLKPDVASYSCVVNACAKSNDIARAEQWLCTMKEADVAVNAVTYNSIINACARCGDLRRAEAWLAQLENEGFIPSVVTFNILIKACGKAGDLDRAEHWLKEIHRRSLSPDAVSYMNIIQGCLAKKDMSRAEPWAQEMQEMRAPHATVPAYGLACTMLVEGFGLHRDYPQAKKWLLHALAAGFQGTTEGYSYVVKGCLNAGNLEEAEDWLDRLAAAGLPMPCQSSPGSAAQVACTWERRGDPERAAAIMQKLANGAAISQRVRKGCGRAPGKKKDHRTTPACDRDRREAPQTWAGCS